VIRKLFKYSIISIVCIVVVAPSSALLYRAYLQHNVAEKRAITSANGINSFEAVRIGAIDQWIEVRGQDVDNPILLWIHGGPGVAFVPLAGAFQDPLEKYFTIVQWDQRGAGKTYASNDKELQRRTMSVPQMEQDTLDVANYLRSRFKREKIFVIGHSWGSVLGLWLAHEHPDMIYAYVGVGQLINAKQNQQAMYQDELQQARDRHNEQAIKQLESIAPYPTPNFDSIKDSVVHNWSDELLGPAPTDDAFINVRRILSDLLSAPEYSLMDDYGFMKGRQFSFSIIVPQMDKIDLNKIGLDFGEPIFFFEGRHDPACRPSLIWDYSQTIKASQKGFVWFENSGHFPFYEEQQRFRDELVQQVLPLAKDRPANFSKCVLARRKCSHRTHIDERQDETGLFRVQKGQQMKLKWPGRHRSGYWFWDFVP
jgi:proline iminopeptidase